MSTDNRSFDAFLGTCEENLSRQGHIEQYLYQQASRLYSTFQLASKYVSDGDRILSVGAGPAYVEVNLKQRFDLDVTVAEFPGGLEKNRDLYAYHDFDTIGCDLSDPDPFETEERYDLVLACEIVEHLPKPPRRLIEFLGQHVASDGHLLLTTPNLARIDVIGKLLLNRPIFASPPEFFSETSFENEYVHRREYVPAEIVDEIDAAGMELVNSEYMFMKQVRNRSRKRKVLYLLERVVPRFRPITAYVARDAPQS